MLGRRVEISKKIFLSQLRDLYTSLSRQTSLNTANPQSASRQLFNQLIGPIAPLLEARGQGSLEVRQNSVPELVLASPAVLEGP